MFVSLISEVRVHAISAVSNCSTSIDINAFKKTPFSCRTQHLVALAIDTLDEYLRTLGLTTHDLFELTISLLNDDDLCRQSNLTPDTIADAIASQIVATIDTHSHQGTRK